MTSRQIEDAVVAMHRAGCLLLEGQDQVPWKLKDDGTFVTDLDLQVEDTLGSVLRIIFAGCRFIGEEDPSSWSLTSDSRPKIVLDPIDGTAPFVRGLNYFAISLAVVEGSGQPLLAIIYLPGLRKWCVASFEDLKPTMYEVTFQGDAPLMSVIEGGHPGPKDWSVEHCYIYVGSDAHRQLDLSAYQGKVRALGATAAHLALLTDNTTDPVAVVLSRYKIWDIVAGLALASAAGLDIRNLTSGAAFHFEELFGHSKVWPVLLVGPSEVLNALADSVRVREG